MPPIDRGQTRLARPYPRGLFAKAAARTRTLDPETAAKCLISLGTHGQPAALQQRYHMAEAAMTELHLRCMGQADCGCQGRGFGTHQYRAWKRKLEVRTLRPCTVHAWLLQNPCPGNQMESLSSGIELPGSEGYVMGVVGCRPWNWPKVSHAFSCRSSKQGLERFTVPSPGCEACGCQSGLTTKQWSAMLVKSVMDGCSSCGMHH